MVMGQGSRASRGARAAAATAAAQGRLSSGRGGAGSGDGALSALAGWRVVGDAVRKLLGLGAVLGRRGGGVHGRGVGLRLGVVGGLAAGVCVY